MTNAENPIAANARSAVLSPGGRAFRLALLFALAGSALLFAATASAAPRFNLDVHHSESNFPPGGTGQFWFDVNNVGADATSGLITLSVNLPSGMTRDAILDQTQGGGSVAWSCPGSPGQTAITCTTTGQIPRHSLSRRVLVRVNIAPAASGDRFLSAKVSGGGAPAAPPAAGCAAAVAACAVDVVHIDPAPAAFGIVDGTFKADFFDEDGVTPARQSGSHPDLGTFAFDLNSITPSPGDQVTKLPAGNVRNLRVDLPRGFLGDPTAIDECIPAELTIGSCPASSQVGRFDARLWSGQGEPWGVSLGVFNMTHPKGAVNDLAFVLFGNPIHIKSSLDPANNYAIKTVVADINETAPVFHQQLTLWGVPADPSHDSERCSSFNGSLGGNTGTECPAGMPRKPFLTVPFDCTVANEMKLSRYDSWEDTGLFGPDVFYAMPGKQTGCAASQAEFQPSAAITPTDTRADTPTGLDVQAIVPFNDDPDGVATPPVKRIEVALPQGVSVNPSFADGLNGCTEAEIGISHAGVPDGAAVTCPDQARIGSVELSTPLLPAPLEGSIYLAKPNANPFDSLFAIYVVVHDTEERGVLVKIPGRMDLDPDTGQITTTFDDLPQFPADDLSVQFRGGDRAPLINPPTCGVKTIEGTLNTYAEPALDVAVDSSYQITQGPDGGACSPDRSARPFAPRLRAGATDPVAGRFSPFVLRLTRADGEQELTGVTADLPQGLLGKLAGVGQCADVTLASIPTAPGTGAAEKANPSCPASSLVGRVNAGTGAGPLPFYVRGSAYLAGPYKGAPLSLAIVTPAVAGGIDLGNVVIRTALYIDPKDAHLRAVSDPLPTILHGVPVHLRDVRVVADRPDFTLNPTDCDEMAVSGEASGAGASLVGPADDTRAPLRDRFQVGGCGDLPFAPRIAFKLKGGMTRGDHPSLESVVRPRPGDANISRAVVTLPRSAFLDQAHIRTVCTRVQFAADQCPKGSIYGQAVAYSPLLDFPLRGSVHLRSSDNQLPDLVADLRGPAHQPIRVELVGKTDSSRGALRSTFDLVPDAAVSRFRLQLFGGKRGLIINSRDLCGGTVRATVELDAHNGRALDRRPVVRNSCKKKRKRGHRRSPR